MKPVSLAHTNSEKAEMASPETPMEEYDDYPYGLTLHLSNSSLKKLGYGDGKLQPGMKVALMGVAMVSSADARSINTAREHSASLQVQSLALAPPEPEKSRSDALYPGE